MFTTFTMFTAIAYQTRPPAIGTQVILDQVTELMPRERSALLASCHGR